MVLLIWEVAVEPAAVVVEEDPVAMEVVATVEDTVDIMKIMMLTGVEDPMVVLLTGLVLNRLVL